jgi:nitrogen regulatory protein P-II 1
MVLPDYIVDDVIDAIVRTASTGAIGDGKIFLSKIDHAVRIRNQQVGAAAL